MFLAKVPLARSIRASSAPSSVRTVSRLSHLTKPAPRFFSTTKMATFPTPSSDPPKHEMQYFPDMVNALPSASAEFRRVLWTGLYTQLVLMTIPVGGDIGEEVRLVSSASSSCPPFSLNRFADPHSRPNPDLYIRQRSRPGRRERAGSQGG
jgi:hypothetical protein